MERYTTGLIHCPYATFQERFHRDDDQLCWYLSVFLVAAVDLCDALLGAFSGRRAGEGLLHPDGAFPQTALDTKGFIELIHLKAHKEPLHL